MGEPHDYEEVGRTTVWVYSDCLFEYDPSCVYSIRRGQRSFRSQQEVKIVLNTTLCTVGELGTLS